MDYTIREIEAAEYHLLEDFLIEGLPGAWESGPHCWKKCFQN